MSRLRRHLSVQNVLSTLLLAAVLATGVAVAASGPNVRRVDGVEIRGFEHRSQASTAPKTMLRVGDLRLEAGCDGDGDLGLSARSTSADAVYASVGPNQPNDDFELDVGEELQLDVDGQRDAVYRSASGQVIAVHYAADDDDPLGGRAECLVAGYTFAR
jgi:hypothetical protein